MNGNSVRLALFLTATTTALTACGGETAESPTSESPPPTTVIDEAPTPESVESVTTVPETTTTTTTLPPGLLPVPADDPLPPVSRLENVSVTLTPVADITLALGMAWSEIEGYFYIITQPGQVYRADRDFTTTELVLDLTNEVSPFIYGSERGMLGVAVNPIDGRLFLNFTDLDYNSNIVSYALNDGVPDPDSRRQVLFVEQPGVSHKAGMLFFDDEGSLFVSFGDGGNNKGRTSQDYTSLLGGILKIVPNPDSDGYSIPEDNPFVGDAFIRPEIYVKGLRQPHRFAYNRANGDIYVGDVGENSFEELNYLPAGTSGVNFGWPFMEGFGKRLSGGDHEFTPPIYQFAHPSWVALIAGYVYHGDKIPDLTGALLFGDMTGKISALGADGIAALPISETGNILTSFAEGPDGEIYTLSLDQGVKRIDPA